MNKWNILSIERDIGNAWIIAIWVENGGTLSAAAEFIDAAQAWRAVVSTLSSRVSIDFEAALGFISPPAVAFSGVHSMDYTVFDFDVARLAGSSEGADNEEDSNKEEGLELSSGSHCMCEGLLWLLCWKYFVL